MLRDVEVSRTSQVMLSRQQIWVLVAGIGTALVIMVCGIWAVWYSMDVRAARGKASTSELP